MPRIAIIDTYYPDFIQSLPDPINGTYDAELRKVLDKAFGTSDFYSHALTAEGWECIDIIANHGRLQARWVGDNHVSGLWSMHAVALAQIDAFKPDVVFMQDLSFFDAATLATLSKKYLLAGQCSCPMPRPENVSKFHTLFSSFPHYIDRFKALGVQAHYLPLAFDPRMLSEESPVKQFDISFVGGVGKKSHWKAGTEMLERVAAEFKERFVWFGYGVENLEKGSPLIPCYAGQAWGLDVYSVYGRSKIVVNRHGEVAEGYSNNLRMFEATGMGAMLVTEWTQNLADLFPEASVFPYVPRPDNTQSRQFIDDLNYALRHVDEVKDMASKGQKHTLANHTYAHRMKVVSDVLTAALVGQAA